MPFLLSQFSPFSMAAHLLRQTPPPPASPAPNQLPQWLIDLLNGDYGSLLNQVWPSAVFLVILGGLIYLLIRYRNAIRKFAANWLPWMDRGGEPSIEEEPESITPLADRENASYVDLESGMLVDLKPMLSLRTRKPTGSDERFEEKRTFANLQEVLDYDDNGHRYPALALLGEPGSGKTWMLRKFARDLRQQRETNTSAKIPLLVSLSGYKGVSRQNS